ncbi:bolA 1 [Orbilia javanica]|uniref:BolA 1 n=1 Tax=Orbilia javanica TaxID=47235 RepID=A0AAN8NZH4_9PEZI
MIGLRRLLSTMAAPSLTPMEDIIRRKITETFNPISFQIFNDSHKHAHHAPMQGVTSKETHFRLEIISEAFEKQTQMARHRSIYALLKDEMSEEGGIHALQLKTRTPKEAGEQVAFKIAKAEEKAKKDERRKSLDS